jgi:type I restriction enzyme S subunit
MNFFSGTTPPKDERAQKRSMENPFPIYGANGVMAWFSERNHAPAVLLGKIGSAGALNRSFGDLWATNNVFAVSSELFSVEAVWQVLARVDFVSLVGGSANPYLPFHSFAHVEVPIPRERALESFESEARDIVRAHSAADGQSGTLEQLRDALLPELMSGRLRVRDAEKVVEGAV